MHPYPSVLHLSRIQRAHHTQLMPVLLAYSLVWTLTKRTAAEVVSDYLINSEDMSMIYVSPDRYATVFEEELDLRKSKIDHHPTAGLILFEKNNRILLASMAPGTPGAPIARWRTRIRGAWLIEVDDTPVTSISDAKAVFTRLSHSNSPRCTLLFSHPEVNPVS